MCIRDRAVLASNLIAQLLARGIEPTSLGLALVNAAEPLLAAPFERLESGFDYALSGWRNLQSCADYSRAAIDDFRAQFQGRGPEQVGVAPFGS